MHNCTCLPQHKLLHTRDKKTMHTPILGLPMQRVHSAPMPAPSTTRIHGRLVAGVCVSMMFVLLLIHTGAGRLPRSPLAAATPSTLVIAAPAPLGTPSAIATPPVAAPCEAQRTHPRLTDVSPTQTPDHGLGAREPVVPLVQLKRSLIYTGGANARARRVLHELIAGAGTNSSSKNMIIKIGAVGGSITAGARATRPGVNDWFSQVVDYMTRSFPHATIIGRNSALSATPSMLMDFCLEDAVDADVDLVFVEYCANDSPPTGVDAHDTMVLGGYERLLRRILNIPSSPAVVLVQSMTKGMMYPSSAPGKRGYLETREDAYGALAQYYELPWLSVRALWWPEMQVKQQRPKQVARTLLGAPTQEAMRSPFLSELDDFHPNDLGHTAMADMVAYWLQQTAIALAQDPLSNEDARLAVAPVPAPALPGNYQAKNLACDFGANLVRNAADLSMSHGFAVVDEGVPFRPKIGLHAKETGARLLIRVNTTRSDGPGKNTTVLVAYQQSWQPMGNARISCVLSSACACEPLEKVAAHLAVMDPAARQTVAVVARLSVTQSPACEIAVDVLPEPGPDGSHKFKVVGVMVSEFEGAVHVFGEAQ